MVKHEGSSKTYGPRYGWTLKKKLDKILVTQKKEHKCPYCGKEKVKKVSVGIWFCKGCSAKFTSSAYNVTKTKA